MRLTGDFLHDSRNSLVSQGEAGPLQGPRLDCAVHALLCPFLGLPVSPRLREEVEWLGGPHCLWPRISLTFLVLLFGDHSHSHGARKLALPTMGQAGNLY